MKLLFEKKLSEGTYSMIENDGVCAVGLDMGSHEAVTIFESTSKPEAIKMFRQITSSPGMYRFNMEISDAFVR